MTVVPDPQPPCRPLPPTPRDEPRQLNKVSTPPLNHQSSSGGGTNMISSGQAVSHRNSHVFKPTVSQLVFYYYMNPRFLQTLFWQSDFGNSNAM